MKRSRLGSLVIGAFIIFIGVALLMDRMGITAFATIFSTFWPLFVIILAVSRFVVGDWKGGVIMGIIGVVAQLSALGILQVSVWSIVWPLIIIMFGLSIIAGHVFDFKAKEDTSINETVLFSGLEKVVTQEAFEGGNIVTLFGGADIDVRNAKFKEGKAVLDIFVAFGGVAIIVPADVNVEMEVIAVFGGTSDKRPKAEATKKQTLKVRGYALFGGVDVKANTKQD